jgi:hypothetical protein
VNKGSEKEPNIVKKFTIADNKQEGQIYIVHDDLEGNYDYQVDVENMSVNSDDQRRQARQTTLSLLITNPNVVALLAQDNTKPKFKELMISWLEELGWPDAERYFEDMQPMSQPIPPEQDPLGQIMGQMTQNAAGQGPQQPGLGVPAIGGGGPAQPALVAPDGYFNFAPPNSLMGVPAYIQQKYAAQSGTAGAYGGPNPVQGQVAVVGT